ncbi:MAG: phosphatase PAP2 family protein [Bacteroidia bacterium]
MLRSVFILIGFLVSFGAVSQNADLRLLKAINATDHPKWDNAMKITSDGIYPFMGLSTAGLLITGYIQKDPVMIRNGWKTGIAIGTTLLLTEGLKYSVQRKRPFVAYPDEIVCRKQESGFSFPSGHTSAAFSTATALTLSTKKWYVGVPAYAYASLVAYSRMRLGVHYPSDVIAGIVLGIGTSLLTWQVDKWMNKH